MHRALAVQLRDILWAEIAKWYRHSLEIARESGLPPLSMMFEITQDKIAARGAPKEWFAVARTARPSSPMPCKASMLAISPFRKTAAR